MPMIERHVDLPAEPDRAWGLLVDPEDQPAWLGREVDLPAMPGHAGSVVDHDGTHRQLVVDEVEVGRRIVWTWWPSDDDGAASRVEITLEPIEEGTRVTVVEQSHPAGPQARARASATPAAASGWSLRLFHLELLVALVATVRA
jgi:uncharacterized protein YndB with AHSA1/START domain